MITPESVLEASEALISRRPVIVRRRVKWGECDPALVVYTPRFAEYVVSAAAFFVDEVLGRTLAEGRADHSNGLPLRALSFEFEQSLHAGEVFDMRIEVAAVRSSTFELAITGLRMDGAVAFRCKYVPISIAAEARRAVPLPDNIKAALESYASECSAAAEVRP